MSRPSLDPGTSAKMRLLVVLFRACVWWGCSVGIWMVRLAAGFRLCRRAAARFGIAVIPVQIVLWLLWAPTRLLFIALHEAARASYAASNRLAASGAEV